MLLLVLAAPAARAQFAVQVPAPFGGHGYGLAVADGGRVLVGDATGTFDADPGPGEALVSTAQTGIATAYDADGAFRWVWVVPTEPDGTERSVLKSVAPRPGGGTVVAGQLRGDADLGAAGPVSGRDVLLVVALDAGGTPVWAAVSEGRDTDTDVLPEAVATGADGSVYVTGTYSGTPDLDPGPGERVLPFASRRVAFVASYTAAGAFRWAFNIGAGIGNVRAEGIAVSPEGVFVTGSFLGTTDFDPGPGEALRTQEGSSGYDGFVARYTADGALGWATSFGRRSRSDYGFAIAADGAGGVVVGGSRAIIEGTQTWGQAFLGRFDATGQPVWAQAWGAPRPNGEINRDEVHAVAVDGATVLAGGWLYAPVDADPGPGETVLTPAGLRDGFLARYTLGGAFSAAAALGGEGADDVAGVALADGLVVAGGTVAGTETFPDGTQLTSASASGTAFAAAFALRAPLPPLSIVVAERVVVGDAGRLLEALRLRVAEAVGVADRVRFYHALVLAIEEQIAVTDDPRLIQALQLMLQETVAALDAVGAAQADGSGAVSEIPVLADTLVSFLGPVGLDVVLEGVTGAGALAVRFVARRAATGRVADVAPFRWRLTPSGALAAETATVRVDLAALGGFRQPETVAVGWRAGAEGPFTPLPTRHEAGEAVAVLPALAGELILTGEGVPVGGEPSVPAALALSAPAPNPASGAVRLGLDLPEAGDVRLEAFDARGRRVAVLLDGPLAAGAHEVRLRAGALAPGVYLLRLTADAGTARQTLTVAR